MLERKQKLRMLGNIKFIGELYKRGMLVERIMHECIQHLMVRVRTPGFGCSCVGYTHSSVPHLPHGCAYTLITQGNAENPNEEDLEALCKLLGTIGKALDHAKAAQYMNIYFQRLTSFSKNQKLSSRIRYVTQLPYLAGMRVQPSRSRHVC